MTPLERARGAIGTPFRLHGRGGGEGIDCVGLAALAYGVTPPRGYALRTGDPQVVIAVADAAGLVEVEDARAGDLLLFRVGAGQLHLAIASQDGIIHADASLRRVVERPGPAPWNIVKRWRRN